MGTFVDAFVGVRHEISLERKKKVRKWENLIKEFFGWNSSMSHMKFVFFTLLLFSFPDVDNFRILVFPSQKIQIQMKMIINVLLLSPMHAACVRIRRGEVFFLLFTFWIFFVILLHFPLLCCCCCSSFTFYRTNFNFFSSFVSFSHFRRIIFQEWTTARVRVVCLQSKKKEINAAGKKERQWNSQNFYIFSKMTTSEEILNVWNEEGESGKKIYMNPIWTIIDLLSWLIQHTTPHTLLCIRTRQQVQCKSAVILIIGNCHTIYCASLIDEHGMSQMRVQKNSTDYFLFVFIFFRSVSSFIHDSQCSLDSISIISAGLYL